MEKRLHLGLVGIEIGTAIAAFALTFIVNPSLGKLQSEIGKLNSNPLYYSAYFGLIIVSIILVGLGGKNFQTLYSNKKITSKDKNLGLLLLIISWSAIVYLYFMPLFSIVNSI